MGIVYTNLFSSGGGGGQTGDSSLSTREPDTWVPFLISPDFFMDVMFDRVFGLAYKDVENCYACHVR